MRGQAGKCQGRILWLFYARISMDLIFAGMIVVLAAVTFAFIRLCDKL